jgi:hypothetical protein
MRMIQITAKTGEVILVNPDQIAQLWYCSSGSKDVIISLSGGPTIRTQFTTIDHALDYIQRAPSHSLVGG